MENFNLKEHDFNEAKNAIKKFSENSDSVAQFSTVAQKNWLFSHNVTGEELNKFIMEVQAQFYGAGKTQVEIIKEFGQIYNALESLDKGYIQGIMLSVNGVEEDQKEIKNLFKVQTKTVEKLQNLFKTQEDTVHKLEENIEILKKVENKVNHSTPIIVALIILFLISISNLVINILQLMHII